MKSYYDLHYMLEQHAYGRVTKAQLDRAFRGVNLDRIFPGGDGRMLPNVVFDGNEPATAYLLERGAKPNLEGRYGGNALQHALESTVANRATKVRLVKLLLDAGAKPEAAVAHAIERARDEKKTAGSSAFDGDSRRHAKQMLASYLETLPIVLARCAEISPALRKKVASLGVKAASAPKKLDVAKVRAKIKRGDRTNVYEACEALGTEAAVAHPDWLALVKSMVDASRTFEDVAKETYGERVSFEDDEGSLAQGWDEWVLIDLVLEMLAKEPSVAHPKWASAVEHALRARRKFHATDYCEDAVAALLSAKHVRAHASYKALCALEKKTR